jgi:methyltransferase
MVGRLLFTGLIAATAAERIIEVGLSKRNAAWSMDQGGIEYGRGHYPFMVVLHTLFLFACVGEVWLMERSFEPWLGYPALAVAILCQGLRWWCISTLGKRWNTRVIIVKGLPRVASGPYGFIPHPNYLAVALEGVALPLVHGAYLTAAGFTVLNAGLMAVRIRCENTALSDLMET